MKEPGDRLETCTVITSTFTFTITAQELRRALCDYFDIMDPESLLLASGTTIILHHTDPDDQRVLTARWTTTKREGGS